LVGRYVSARGHPVNDGLPTGTVVVVVPPVVVVVAWEVVVDAPAAVVVVVAPVVVVVVDVAVVVVVLSEVAVVVVAWWQLRQPVDEWVGRAAMVTALPWHTVHFEIVTVAALGDPVWQFEHS